MTLTDRFRHGRGQCGECSLCLRGSSARCCVGTLDRRIRPTDDPADPPVSGHARRLITECLRLGALEEFAELRLTEWAHMLGFRGHFSTNPGATRSPSAACPSTTTRSSSSRTGATSAKA
ncbi:replication initiator [Actinomadura darangshiensis]|uniref:replication initiator n=1 Tax=Actinomadura darangshiensis TaxID=705336 RepID=UPI003C7B9F9E